MLIQATLNKGQPPESSDVNFSLTPLAGHTHSLEEVSTGGGGVGGCAGPPVGLQCEDRLMLRNSQEPEPSGTGDD